ncbi:S46 family peptidase [Salinisphaera hydrothermalis]|uniref:Dipeptidyl-peptidase n=1 Tax=Salinisphaera hydrothermalis (strain C41B8) TaxID=1304275 RepID=A0A084IHA6_SALHC|nr:S46 family peptidase [Salinisphaera hydrothermalis]KEZ76090.1 Peptidase S46 [Salinisphaera hydrothermalis C41B8]
MQRIVIAALAAAGVGFSVSAAADEGMWTLNDLPTARMKQAYGFAPDPAWVDRVQKAAVRLAGGCSGSFVSADGLVMSNHHCANECLSRLSNDAHNYMTDGFVGKEEDEPKCPNIELNQLVSITNVTDKVDAALADKTGAARVAAQRAVDSSIEQACVAGDPDQWRCDVITLYHGGRYALYKYRRFQDVRMVFAPEQSIAFFGGDPDNFNFPRYDLDLTLLRAYVDGKPAHTPNYLPFDVNGPKAGEMTFVVGNPGSTQRETSWTALAYLRDEKVIPYQAYLSEERGVLWQFSRESARHAQAAQDDLFYGDNTLKVFKGWLATLTDESFIAKKKAEDTALRQWIAADPARVKQYGHPWRILDKAEAKGAEIQTRYDMLERGQAFGGDLFKYARTLVRAAAERDKPDAKRLPEYRSAHLPAVQQSVTSSGPIYPDYEQTRMAWALEKMRQALGADDPFVKNVLGDQSPDELAKRLVSGTKLADPAYRKKLWQGGERAIEQSDDPMIVFARQVDPAARTVRKTYEDDVEAPTDQAETAIAKARFARDGAKRYPDATFTLRLTYGRVKGWIEKGKKVAPFTHIDGLYARATGADPYKLPARWIQAKDKLDGNTPVNFVTDNDIIGGNSGSPVIDKAGHAVGLIFDGNIHSLGGNFTFNDANNRAVAVDTAFIETALRKVYDRNDLADELARGHRS